MQKKIQEGVLLGYIFFSCCLLIHIHRAETGKGVFLDMSAAVPGQPIIVSTTGIRRTQIKSCVWYVGEQEALRESALVPYTPSLADAEHFIRVAVTLKNGEYYEDSLYFSILPVLYLESGTAYEDVGRESYVPVKMKLTSEAYDPSSQLYDGEAQIRLRGNSTSDLPKRPFKLRLEEKTDLLGLAETRHWVLLANAFDSTMLRNKLVYNFAEQIGSLPQMHSQHVTLIYNDTYQGVYQLCQQVRIDKTSVNIYDWEDAAKETAEQIAQDLASQKLITVEEQPVIALFLETDLLLDFSWMKTRSFDFPCLKSINHSYNRQLPTEYRLEKYLDFDQLPDPVGGMLLEMDFFHIDANLKTHYDLPLYFNTPLAGDTFEELDAYTRTYIQALEYAFHDTDFTYHDGSPHYRMLDQGWFDWYGEYTRRDVQYEPVYFSAPAYDGVHYSELVDFDSLLVNFLVCEFTVNWDSMKNSVYLYKDIDGPFYLSPVWDYDWAWGNSAFTIDTWEPEIWQTTDEYFASENYYQTVQWNRYLIRDPYFLVRVYEKYWQIRDSEIEAMICRGGLIDTYAEQIRTAAQANDAKWGGSMGTFKGQKFEEGILSLKDFIGQRIAWMDEQFSSVESLRVSLGYYITDEILQVEPADTASYENMTGIRVRCSSPDCTAISFQVNGTHFFTAELQEGTAVGFIPDSALRQEENALNTVQVRALDENGEYLINPEGSVWGDYTNALSNYTYFSKPSCGT
jgi:hypothetical protein